MQGGDGVVSRAVLFTGGHEQSCAHRNTDTHMSDHRTRKGTSAHTLQRQPSYKYPTVWPFQCITILVTPLAIEYYVNRHSGALNSYDKCPNLHFPVFGKVSPQLSPSTMGWGWR